MLNLLKFLDWEKKKKKKYKHKGIWYIDWR